MVLITQGGLHRGADRMSKGKEDYSSKIKEIIKQVKDGQRLTYSIKGEKGTEKKPPPASVFLVMKNREDDIGQRPLENPSYGPPGIWVEEYTPDDSEGNRIGSPQAESQYQIAAEVHNLGLAASYCTFVEFYWIDPSTSRSSGERINPVGSTKLVTINSGSSTIVRSDLWIPEYVNDGHECLKIRAYDPLMDPMDLNSYNQTEDRHVGHKNLNISIAEPKTNTFLSLKVWSSLPDEQHEEFDMSASLMSKFELQELIERNSINAVIGKKKLAYFGFLSKADLWRYWFIETIGYSMEKALTAFEINETSSPLPLKLDTRYARLLERKLKISIEQGETEKIWVVLGIPVNAKKGEAYGFTVTQWSGNTIVGKFHKIVLIT